MKEYIDKIVKNGKQEDMDCLSNILVDSLYKIKEYDYNDFKKYKNKIKGMAYNYQIDEELAKEIVEDMKPLGEYWSMETVASVIGNDTHRFIPEVYFTAPTRVRMSLLEGMIDTCKYAVQHINPVWGYSCKSLHLIQGFVELARSLGVKVTYTSDVDCKSIYTVSCRSDFNPYRFSSKHDNFQKALSCIQKSSFHQYPKMIKSVEYVGKTLCQCILLNNKTHTYITDGYT